MEPTYILEAFNTPDMEKYDRLIRVATPQSMLEEAMMVEWKQKKEIKEEEDFSDILDLL